MEIKIKTNSDKIYEQYLTLINPLLSKDKRLTEFEIKVLSKMYQIYYKYLHLGEKLAMSIVFHQETKLRIRQVIGRETTSAFTKYSMNTIIWKIRNKGYIKDDKLTHIIPIKDNKIDLNFILTIDDRKDDYKPVDEMKLVTIDNKEEILD
jgi:hypothetical protein